jgi:hypothetical protein
VRLGLIGLGRIGSFHAQTPTDLPVVDALENGWIAEACTTSLRLHRPVRMEEVRS